VKDKDVIDLDHVRKIKEKLTEPESLSIKGLSIDLFRLIEHNLMIVAHLEDAKEEITELKYRVRLLESERYEDKITLEENNYYIEELKAIQRRPGYTNEDLDKFMEENEDLMGRLDDE